MGIGHITKSENNLFKNKVKSLIEKAKKSYYKNLFDRNRNDIRATWNSMKILINKTKNDRRNF